MEQLKSKKGITLIALVITIIVLIILAGVSINLVLGDKGIITIAKDAKENTLLAEEEEKNKLNKLYLELEEATAEPSVETIDKAESKVGCYADINGDGTPDGVIYADLAVAVSGRWASDNGTFSYEAKTGTKDYYVSGSYTGKFSEEAKDVISVVDGSTGEDRFYVMALENVNGTKKDGTTTNCFCWYYAAAYDGGISDYATVTSTSFGKGKENTSTMITKWKETAYGAQNDGGTLDMWGVIEDKVKEGWFVPSKEEWSAFGYNLGITTDNYTNKDLPEFCWSSSLYDSCTAWDADFTDGFMGLIHLIKVDYVRLSATF